MSPFLLVLTNKKAREGSPAFLFVRTVDRYVSIPLLVRPDATSE